MSSDLGEGGVKHLAQAINSLCGDKLHSIILWEKQKGLTWLLYINECTWYLSSIKDFQTQILALAIDSIQAPVNYAP